MSSAPEGPGAGDQMTGQTADPATRSASATTPDPQVGHLSSLPTGQLSSEPPPRPLVGGHALGSHRLGPHVVGQRIVVRRRLPGETGPSGGQAFSDTLGICLVWADQRCVIAKEDGTQITVDIDDIVSGKPVPPRPAPRFRVTATEAQIRAMGMWPDLVTAELGEWVLRRESGSPAPGTDVVARANSVLAFGDPGTGLDEALAVVRAFYTDRAPWLQVEADSPMCRALISSGARPAREGEGDTLFQLASVSRVLRTCSSQQTIEYDELQVDAETGLVTLGSGGDGGDGHGEIRARAVASLDGDWVGLRDIWVDPDHRRCGLGVAVIAGALDWAASQGALTTYLQVRADNLPAVNLYERLGWTTHHAYRYLTASPGIP